MPPIKLNNERNGSNEGGTLSCTRTIALKSNVANISVRTNTVNNKKSNRHAADISAYHVVFMVRVYQGMVYLP